MLYFSSVTDSCWHSDIVFWKSRKAEMLVKGNGAFIWSIWLVDPTGRQGTIISGRLVNTSLPQVRVHQLHRWFLNGVYQLGENLLRRIKTRDRSQNCLVIGEGKGFWEQGKKISFLRTGRSIYLESIWCVAGGSKSYDFLISWSFCEL